MPNESKNFCDTKSLTKIFGNSGSYWNQLRVSGDGPPFYNLGSRVIYDLDEVQTWLAKHKRRSTSDSERAGLLEEAPEISSKS